jgi:hypothetical protein
VLQVSLQHEHCVYIFKFAPCSEIVFCVLFSGSDNDTLTPAKLSFRFSFFTPYVSQIVGTAFAALVKRNLLPVSDQQCVIFLHH